MKYRSTPSDSLKVLSSGLTASTGRSILEAMVASATEGFVILDSDDRVVDATGRARDLLGASLGPGDEFVTTLAPSSREAFESRRGEAAVDGRPFRVQPVAEDREGLVCRLVEADDDLMVIVSHGAGDPPEGQHETPARATNLARDLARLADSIPQLAWMADAEGWIFWYNQRWYDYTGTTLKEMNGWGWTKVHHPAEVDRVKDRFKKAIDSGEPWEDTFPLRGVNGTYRWFLSRALPIRDEEGRVEGWFGTNTDVTDLREMEMALRNSEARHRALAGRLQAVLDVLPVGVFIADEKGTLQMTNEAACKIWGGKTPLVDRNAFGAYRGRFVSSGRPLQADDWAMARALEGEEVIEGEEIEIDCFDGSRKTILNYALSIESGGAVAVSVDVTKHRETEDELRELNETLERRVAERTETLEMRNRELQSFAYVASHDLQEPLRKIQTFADLIMADHAHLLEGEAGDFLGRMHDAATRMKQLLSDLLSYSRVTTNRHAFTRVDVRRVVDEVLEDLELALEHCDADVVVHADVQIHVDRGQLRQLLNHLVLNAIKFRRDGVRLRIILDAGQDEDAPDFVRIAVTDNGIGFDEKYARRIFQPFERLHGQQVYEGTGMGLAICRRIVDRHGGTIDAYGTPGEGSRFVVRLPADQPKP